MTEEANATHRELIDRALMGTVGGMNAAGALNIAGYVLAFAGLAVTAWDANRVWVEEARQRSVRDALADKARAALDAVLGRRAVNIAPPAGEITVSGGAVKVSVEMRGIVRPSPDDDMKRHIDALWAMVRQHDGELAGLASATAVAAEAAGQAKDNAEGAVQALREQLTVDAQRQAARRTRPLVAGLAFAALGMLLQLLGSLIS